MILTSLSCHFLQQRRIYYEWDEAGRLFTTWKNWYDNMRFNTFGANSESICNANGPGPGITNPGMIELSRE